MSMVTYGMVTDKKDRPRKQKKGISAVGILIAGICGFLAAAGAVALFDVTEEKAWFILYVLWIFFGGFLGICFDEMGL